MKENKVKKMEKERKNISEVWEEGGGGMEGRRQRRREGRGTALLLLTGTLPERTPGRRAAYIRLFILSK